MESTSSAAPADARRSGLLTAALGLVVLVIGLVFAFESGFGVAACLPLTVVGLRAERTKDPREIVTIAQQAAFVGEKLFAPAGLLVLLMGIGMVVHQDLGWGHFWIV